MNNSSDSIPSSQTEIGNEPPIKIRAFDYGSQIRFHVDAHIDNSLNGDLAVAVFLINGGASLSWFAAYAPCRLALETFSAEEVASKSRDACIDYVQDEWKRHRCAKYILSMKDL